MMREYEFAALVYDEEKHEVHCAACGRVIPEKKVIFKAGGRWVCGKCLPGFTDEIPTKCTLCSTAKAAAER